MIRSLRFRLIAFAALAGAAVLYSAWLAMGRIVEHQNARQIARRIDDEAQLIAAAVKPAPNGGARILERRVPAAFSRLGSGSYWEVRGRGFLLRSTSLDGRGLSDDERPHGGWSEAIGPLGEDAVIQRSLPLASAAGPLTVRVAHDEETVDSLEQAIRDEMAHFMLLLGLALAAAAAVQVELALLPLRRLRRGLAAMRGDPLQRLGPSHPTELLPLTSAIDALADARGCDLQRARRRAADLAHTLKTPIAALCAESRRVRANGAHGTADAIDRALALASATIETELARARAAAIRGRMESDSVDPALQVERIFAVLERTAEGQALVFDCAIPAGWRLLIDAEAFMEIFGSLLGNAARHARREVRVAAERSDRRVCFEVADDGPGIAEDAHATAFRRGARLDEFAGGHGLGLSIASDLVEATGGALSLGRAQIGGLSARVSWPTINLKLPEGEFA